MIAPAIKSPFAFSRNPLVLTKAFPASASDKRGGSLRIYIAGEKKFECRFQPPLNIDISEIVDAFLPALPYPDSVSLSLSEPVVQLLDMARLADFDVVAECDFGGVSGEYEHFVLPGGVCRQAYRECLAVNSDIFRERFLNYSSNFFLSTRSSGRILSVKESELFPLYFLVEDKSGSNKAYIEISALFAGQTISFRNLGTGLYVLNLEALRYCFAEKYDIFPSVFNVSVNGGAGCRVIIRDTDPAVENHTFIFRNSLGVPEVVSLEGILSLSPTLGEDESDVFRRFDSTINDFYSDRERLALNVSAEIEVIASTPDEVNSLLDFAASDEVSYISSDGQKLRVIPSIEDLTFNKRITAPCRMKVKLQPSDSDLNITRIFNNVTFGKKSRLFSNEFDKTFN